MPHQREPRKPRSTRPKHLGSPPIHAPAKVSDAPTELAHGSIDRPVAPRPVEPAPVPAPSPTTPADPRQALCADLRAAREARTMSIVDVARVTRIPEKSLQQLEEGRFEELPADVFVRGFLRAFARTVGLDVAAVLARYASFGLPPPPVASDLASTGRVASRAPLRPRARAATVPPPVVASRAPEQVTRKSSLGSSPDGTRRGAVTLAVIILVIVATLTMSYLLRRPSESGDGVTRAPSLRPATTLAAHLE
jgi:hypothetical protein